MIYKNAIGGDHQGATFIVAASDSLHPGRADYVCDGVSDQVEIQAALDQGKDTLLMPGTFNISAGLTSSVAGTSLFGCGKDTMISTSSYIATPIYVTGDYVTLNNFKLKKNQGSGGSAHGYGIDINNADDVTISNVILEGTVLAASPWSATPTWGIHGQYCNRLIYDKCHVSNTGYEALTIWEGCTGCVFSNNVVNHCGFGLVFEKEGTYGNTMIGNTVSDSQKGTGWDILIRSTHGNTVTGNVLMDRGLTNDPLSYAIQIDGLSYNNVIAGNVIINNFGLCIEPESFDNVVCNNVFRNIYNSAITKAVIYVRGCQNVIDGNIINYFEDHGIYVRDAPHTMVLNNHILYGGDGGSYGVFISDDSEECKVSGNHIVGVNYIAICVYVEAGKDASGCILYDNVIEDPFGDVNNTLYGAVSTGATTIQINEIGNIHLGQYIIIEAGGSQDVVQIINMSSDNDDGKPAILTITPALSHDHANGVGITGILKQTRGFNLGGTGTIIPCYIRDNVVKDVTMLVFEAANGKFRNNIGYTTENSGTDTIASASTSKAVTHGLSVTPTAGDIMVTPMGSLGNASFFWVDTYTSTQFTIHTNAAPGADTDFAWKAIVL